MMFLLIILLCFATVCFGEAGLTDENPGPSPLPKGAQKSYPSSVLAISPTGIRFEVAAKALVDQNIEETRDIPASPDSDGLSFKLVRVKGKTYVIRYPGVCT